MHKIYGVIGDPIEHSMSPTIHNDAFKTQNIKAAYHHFHVQTENLPDAVRGMKAIGVSGFNVTIPHKEAVIPLLDEVEEVALAIGAVNTVVNRDGKFIGYNTDGKGFLKALRDQYHYTLAGKKILIIGAGGAARGIYFTLVKESIHLIDIANRTPEKAENLIAECPYEKTSCALSIAEAEKSLGEYDVIIQTTSAGMSPNMEAAPIKIEHIKKGAFVSDIIYNPLQTKFLKEAEQHGAAIQNGLGMFAHQAAFAFEIWTGVNPDTERMKQIVLDKLGGNRC
ncbi:shikimate dehydrogenase [Peribacillus cavernae]|uniref:Shikimate dehydrogenase (NADP(+)) n=1 Tax=Peribacillus cavernae TaxID=1674310 RepID=A0A433HWF0_9BACI|nr:shikimate dehydrogenase [Peribacillus cavernae]MDQ0218228.1 shikimate dehydrogenase [Peribacillus cavernae]RUQ32638.1 shikimate dehydrogenase [Peribacillus cavernae]